MAIVDRRQNHKNIDTREVIAAKSTLKSMILAADMRQNHEKIETREVIAAKKHAKIDDFRP